MKGLKKLIYPIMSISLYKPNKKLVSDGFQPPHNSKLCNLESSSYIHISFLLNRPIYPYENWMDKRTGMIVPREQQYIDQENIVPKVPFELTAILRYFKVFKNDTTILQLRPMISTWWD